jgi:uncharacterized protein
MRSKDKPRLAVIRGIISETNQLASSSNAIQTDIQLISLLRKRKSAAETAAKEFEAAKREDLREKQEREIEVLEGYLGRVQMVGEEEMRGFVRQVVGRMGGEVLKEGVVMKELLGQGGSLEGKMVDRKALAGIVREELGAEGGK